MREAGTTNMGAYLRKMALDGYILRLDLPELKEMLSQLRYMGNNVNQIAKRANEVGVIDEMDIRNARMLAMQRAIDGLSVRPDTAFIDGNRDHGSRYAIETPHQLIVGGDGKSASIAAASILAKVSRDRYVSGELDAKYPQYQFAKYKGYGTKLHYELLDQYGPCPEHRRTFLKKWEAKRHG